MTQRTDTPAAWDERTQLTTFLDYARATAVAKCEGVSAEGAVKAPLPGSPLMTLCGLISHLRWVEYYWLEEVFLDGEEAGPLVHATEEDPDPEMRTAVEVPLPQLLAEYEEQSARFRQRTRPVAASPRSAAGALRSAASDARRRWDRRRHPSGCRRTSPLPHPHT
ncbi:DUF664 domain-containing protein [Kitasatospora sp. NPDC056808]